MIVSYSLIICYRLCELLDTETVKTICTLMLESRPLLLPCLRIVNCLSGNRSTWEVVQTHLPVSAMQKIVNSVTPEWKFEVIPITVAVLVQMHVYS